MALNMKKMKNKMSSLQSGGNGKRWFWKPQDGEQTVRIVPDSDGDPFKEFWFHYNLGDKPGFLSPKRNFGEDCPLDTFVRKLWEDGSDESREMAKKLMAKQRFFSPVIVRGEEDAGVRLWGYSKTVYEKFPSTDVEPRRRSSTLTEDQELAKEFINTEIDYATIFPRKSTTEVKEMLDEYLADGEGNEDVEKYNTENTVDKAFNELLAS